MLDVKVTTQRLRICKWSVTLHLDRARFDPYSPRLFDQERVQRTMERWLRRALDRRGVIPVANEQPVLDFDREALFLRRPEVPTVLKARVFVPPYPDDLRAKLPTLAVQTDVWEIMVHGLIPTRRQTR